MLEKQIDVGGVDVEPDAEALAPQSLRTSLRNRAAAIATRYEDSS
ncbi:MAG: hypothetical protein ACRDXX_19360 [Stackebrandtia sp.]